MSKPTVAICIPIEDRRRHLIERLLPRWNDLYIMGEAVYVLGVQDASPELVAWFRERARWPVVETERFDATKPATRASWNDALFAHIARIRESMRVAALDTGADYLFWLDSDTDPSDIAVVSMLAIFNETRGPMSPKIATGLYCYRGSGLLNARPTCGAGRELPAFMAEDAGVHVGFGCLMMRREVAEACSWADYDPVAENAGEDTYFLKLTDLRPP